jgi:hypothetical protein
MAVLYALRVTVAQVALVGNPLPRVEMSSAKGAGQNALPAADAAVRIHSHHGHVRVDMAGSGGAGLDAGRAGAVEAGDREVGATLIQANDANA